MLKSLFFSKLIHINLFKLGVCLHADRSPQERTENLEKFKQNKVRLLICTDVDARGLDISGLPYGSSLFFSNFPAQLYKIGLF